MIIGRDISQKNYDMMLNNLPKGSIITGYKFIEDPKNFYKHKVKIFYKFNNQQYSTILSGCYLVSPNTKSKYQLLPTKEENEGN